MREIIYLMNFMKKERKDHENFINSQVQSSGPITKKIERLLRRLESISLDTYVEVGSREIAYKSRSSYISAVLKEQQQVASGEINCVTALYEKIFIGELHLAHQLRNYVQMISVLTEVSEKRFRKLGGGWKIIGRVDFDKIKNNRVVFSEYHEWSGRNSGGIRVIFEIVRSRPIK
ncbi:hypothetical protein KC622_02765, partial [Candidatus Dojkabacteria bacterium]|nr:hypothetical protein [Candidatus Dojkabacteria bacterium]